jgi:hypothetical protein
MKKRQLLLITVWMITTFACEYHAEHQSSGSIGIYYSGTTIFKDDTSGIKSISPNGFFRFEVNDNILEAKSNFKGKIMYQVNNGTPDTLLQSKGLALMHEAIKFCRANGNIKNAPFIIK